jgi:hypothetical protein
MYEVTSIAPAGAQMEIATHSVHYITTCSGTSFLNRRALRFLHKTTTKHAHSCLYLGNATIR